MWLWWVNGAIIGFISAFYAFMECESFEDDPHILVTWPIICVALFAGILSWFFLIIVFIQILIKTHVLWFFGLVISLYFGINLCLVGRWDVGLVMIGTTIISLPIIHD